MGLTDVNSLLGYFTIISPSHLPLDLTPPLTLSLSLLAMGLTVVNSLLGYFAIISPSHTPLDLTSL